MTFLFTAGQKPNILICWFSVTINGQKANSCSAAALGRSDCWVVGIRRLAQGHVGAEQMLVITLMQVFQLEAHVCTPRSNLLSTACILPRCLGHRWYSGCWPDRSVYPGGLAEPTSWSGSLQAHTHWPRGTGGGAECTEQPGGAHQTHYSW